jgi:dihydrofolate reductase
MKIKLIWAQARHTGSGRAVIGKDNTIPWRLPEDMAHFKATTLGCPVIMGRKTWDSLPARFRPLPGRANVVVTRQAHWQEEGAHPASTLDGALSLCAQLQPDADTVWVIGGAQIYAETLPLAHSAVVTEIEAAFDGDAFAPPLGPSWQEVAREAHTSATGLSFNFVIYHHTRQGN